MTIKQYMQAGSREEAVQKLSGPTGLVSRGYAIVGLRKARSGYNVSLLPPGHVPCEDVGCGWEDHRCYKK